MSLLHTVCLILTICIQTCKSAQLAESVLPSGEIVLEQIDAQGSLTPNGTQSYGSIKLGQIMSIEFDFTFNGRSNNPRAQYQENFFRIGFSGTVSSACFGEGSGYPSMWLKNGAGTSGLLDIKVSSGTSCGGYNNEMDAYGNLNIGVSHHIKIALNNTQVVVDVTGGGKDPYSRSWGREQTPKTYLNDTVNVYFMSDKYAGTPFNIGNGTFTNIVIKTNIFTFAPTTAPTQTPTTSLPTKTPTHTPSTNPTTTNPTQSPPTKSPTNNPTYQTKSPTYNPSTTPTKSPTENPTITPSNSPSKSPTQNPSQTPTTGAPTENPSIIPSNSPTKYPTSQPSTSPTIYTNNPSISPTTYTIQPTISPTKNPSLYVSINPSISPSNNPTVSPVDGGSVKDITTNSPENEIEGGEKSVEDGVLDSTILGIIIAVSVVSCCMICGIIVLIKQRKAKETKYKINTSSDDFRAKHDVHHQMELGINEINVNSTYNHHNQQGEFENGNQNQSPYTPDGVIKNETGFVNNDNNNHNEFLSDAQKEVMYKTPGGPDTGDDENEINDDEPEIIYSDDDDDDEADGNNNYYLSNAQQQQLHVTKMGLEEYDNNKKIGNNNQNEHVELEVGGGKSYLSEAQRKEIKVTRDKIDDYMYNKSDDYLSEAQRKELKTVGTETGTANGTGKGNVLLQNDEFVVGGIDTDNHTSDEDVLEHMRVDTPGGDDNNNMVGFNIFNIENNGDGDINEGNNEDIEHQVTIGAGSMDNNGGNEYDNDGNVNEIDENENEYEEDENYETIQ